MRSSNISDIINDISELEKRLINSNYSQKRLAQKPNLDAEHIYDCIRVNAMKKQPKFSKSFNNLE